MTPLDAQLLRPNDVDALRAALRSVNTEAGRHVLFGGCVADGTLTLTEFVATRTDQLRNLRVSAGSGAGGRALAVHRPVGTEDYERATTISHEYDGPVLAEGIRAVLAVPVMVDEKPRMVMYAASRSTGLDAATKSSVLRAAQRLAEEIRIRDEVDRRVMLLRERLESRRSATLRDVREVTDDLKELTRSVDDARFQSQLETLARRLMLIDQDTRTPSVATLSPRETDVLALVSLGSTYAEVARHLSLRPETVKSYMRSIMAKLNVRNRHGAVVEARGRGLLT